MAPYVTHRDTETFGQDAGLFRRERWLEARPSVVKKTERIFLRETSIADRNGTWCRKPCLVGRDLGLVELRKSIVGGMKQLEIGWASKDPQPEMKMHWILGPFDEDFRFKEVSTIDSLA